MKSWIRQFWTVVTNESIAISIGSRINDKFKAGIADITRAFSICVELIVIGDIWAVVTCISNMVHIIIQLVRIRSIWTIVAHITNAIPITVRLIFIGCKRAIIHIIRNIIKICIINTDIKRPCSKTHTHINDRLYRLIIKRAPFQFNILIIQLIRQGRIRDKFNLCINAVRNIIGRPAQCQINTLIVFSNSIWPQKQGSPWDQVRTSIHFKIIRSFCFTGIT